MQAITPSLLHWLARVGRIGLPLVAIGVAVFHFTKTQPGNRGLRLGEAMRVAEAAVHAKLIESGVPTNTITRWAVVGVDRVRASIHVVASVSPISMKSKSNLSLKLIDLDADGSLPNETFVELDPEPVLDWTTNTAQRFRK